MSSSQTSHPSSRRMQQKNPIKVQWSLKHFVQVRVWGRVNSHGFGTLCTFTGILTKIKKFLNYIKEVC
ncbi:hypothetical protein QE152_g24321 [Popillia japonica]|uniref:Uncharacterized protein n=1 Tax=Popillia japonica TaxID=7064 RepID=A0AAW1KFF5_POPJA